MTPQRDWLSRMGDEAVYITSDGARVESEAGHYRVTAPWGTLLQRTGLGTYYGTRAQVRKVLAAGLIPNPSVRC